MRGGVGRARAEPVITSRRNSHLERGLKGRLGPLCPRKWADFSENYLKRGALCAGGPFGPPPRRGGSGKTLHPRPSSHADIAQRERVTSRNSVQNYVFSLQQAIKEVIKKISNEKEKVLAKCEEAIELLGNDRNSAAVDITGEAKIRSAPAGLTGHRAKCVDTVRDDTLTSSRPPYAEAVVVIV
ncbi:hypothetical protein MRX96_055607 [Rhipicephalus microplus]